MKKVLFLLVDALATRVVQPAIGAGQLPNIEALRARGSLVPECISIFPSITPAATAALTTGHYPRETGIVGAYWYESDEDRLAYYGDDIWPMIRHGIGNFFQSFLNRLNFEELRVNTVFEHCQDAGLSTAAINSMWFRGKKEHHVDVPRLLSLWPDIPPQETVNGPELLFLGDFVSTKLPGKDKEASAPGGPTRRYGFHDAATSAYLLEVARHGALPEFTLAYFPNNDFTSHEIGPKRAVEELQKFDETLGALFEVKGGIDAFLSEVAVFITGDHSQSDLLADQQTVDLNEVLEGYELVDAGSKWQSGDDVMVCPNMRAAQVYMRTPTEELRRELAGRELADRLVLDHRVDQVIWRDSDVAGDAPRLHVETRDRGQICFWLGSGDDGTSTARDHYGAQWAWEGSLEPLMGKVEDGVLEFPTYPNAFERIATGMLDRSGEIWVTAQPGYEFALPDTSVHNSGSHGSLHALDSTAPLIVAGLPAEVTVPQHARTVDIVPLCFEVLGVNSGPKPGVSRAMPAE